MKANELMIGDWVLYNPNVFIEDEYELPKDPYPTKISCGEDIDLAFEDCYSPIPITSEILEKNGFKNPTLNDPELINYVFKASFEHKSPLPNVEVLRVNYYDGVEWDFYALLGERESSDCGEQYEYINNKQEAKQRLIDIETYYPNIYPVDEDILKEIEL